MVSGAVLSPGGHVRPTFCVFASTAIDYSDGSMLEARSALDSVCTFMEAAQAYMKGQLLTAPVQEAVLWERSRPPASLLRSPAARTVL